MLIVFMMSGCVKANIDMSINKDKSMKLSVTSAVDQSLLQQYGSEGLMDEETKNEAENNGFKVDEYSDGSMSKDPIMLDFTLTNMLINQTFEKALEISLDPETEAKDRAYNLQYTEYGDSVIDSEGYLVEWTYVLDVTTNTLTSHSERVLVNGQPVKADTSIYRDWTGDVQNWYETMLIPDGGIDDEGKYSNANGCIPVTEDIKQFLELLMNKYSFKDVENSWLKLCYYYHYYGANEHASDVL